MRLCDWLFRAILLDRHVLDYAAAYFQLGPIEWRIYEVARSTCESDGLDTDLATFRLQIGYQNPLSNFKAALKQIVATDSIPTTTSNWSRRRRGGGNATPRRGRCRITRRGTGRIGTRRHRLIRGVRGNCYSKARIARSCYSKARTVAASAVGSLLQKDGARGHAGRDDVQDAAVTT